MQFIFGGLEQYSKQKEKKKKKKRNRTCAYVMMASSFRYFKEKRTQNFPEYKEP